MNIEEQIEMTLDKIRPFIQRDGGDVTFDSFEDGIVYLNFLGACEGCSMIGETLSSGVAILLQEEVPGVIDVKLSSEKPKKEEVTESKLDLSILTVTELRDLAKKKEISGYSKMKKDELIQALK